VRAGLDQRERGAVPGPAGQGALEAAVRREGRREDDALAGRLALGRRRVRVRPDALLRGRLAAGEGRHLAAGEGGELAAREAALRRRGARGGDRRGQSGDERYNEGFPGCIHYPLRRCFGGSTCSAESAIKTRSSE